MNWQEERDATLCEARCVVVKVGSAVLSTGSELNLPVLDNLVNQLAVLSRQGRRVVLVSSGAVAAGRTALKKLPGEPAAVGLSGKQAAAAVGQGRLMHLYDNAFAERGILTAQVLLTRDDLKNRTRFLNIRNTFSELLNWGVIPVVNENDTVSVNVNSGFQFIKRQPRRFCLSIRLSLTCSRQPDDYRGGATGRQIPLKPRR